MLAHPVISEALGASRRQDMLAQAEASRLARSARPSDRRRRMSMPGLARLAGAMAGAARRPASAVRRLASPRPAVIG